MIRELEIERVERATALLFRGKKSPIIGSSDWRRELKAAFRQRVLETHPDRARVLGKSEAQLRLEFQLVAEAYQLLGSLTAPIQSRPPADRSAHGSHGSGPRGRREEPPPPPRQTPPYEHFHRGPLPPGPLRFAEFLYYTGRISWRTLVDSITWQRSQRPSIGRIAVGWGHLTESEVQELLESRRREGAQGIPFGEHALRRGMLTPFQLLALLGRQRRMQRRIGQYFIERGFIDSEEIHSIRLAVIRHNARCRSPRGNTGST